MKKKAICIIFLIIGIGFLLFYQKSRLIDQLSSNLQKEHIEVAEIDSSLFPTQLVLSQVKIKQKEWHFFAEKIVINVSLLALFNGDIQIDQIMITNGHLPNTQWEGINLTLKTTALSIEHIPALFFRQNIANPLQIKMILTAQNEMGKFQVEGSIRLNEKHIQMTQIQGQWLFRHPLYNINEMIFTIRQGDISEKNGKYYIDFNDFIVNQSIFSQGRIWLDFQPHLINGRIDLFAQGNLDFNFLILQEKLTFSAHSITLEQWLALLKFPVIATGITQVNGDIQLFSLGAMKGNASFQINKGKIKNINLFSVINQQIPINFDLNYLQDIDTPFEEISADLHWDRKKIEWNNIQLKNRELQLLGDGNVQHAEKQCDFRVNIYPRENQYQSLTLPIHFFGDCDALQYKIDSMQDIRKQLKNFLKQRFSH